MKITVTFDADNRLLQADLFIPDHSAHEESIAAVLIEGAMTGQAAAESEKVARLLCDEGMVCMVLDHEFYRAPGKASLSWESPHKRIEDIVAAIQFFKEHSIVNPDRMVALGISAGAEYLVQALARADTCKGLVVIQNKDEISMNDLCKVLDIPCTLLVDHSVVSAAEDAAAWIGSLFTQGQLGPSRGFVGWENISE